MTRSILSEYNVLDNFWTKEINTTCHASNRLYCHRLLKKTPYELLIGRKPNISFANSLEDLLFYGPLRNKTLLLYPPPKPNMFSPVVIVHNYFG
jgi:hypothetical protein